LDESDSVYELVNRLLAGLIEVVESRDADPQRGIEKIAQGCFFIGMLADLMLLLPDKDLTALVDNEVEQPDLDKLIKEPRQAIEESLCHLQPLLTQDRIAQLRDVLGRWDPQPEEDLKIAAMAEDGRTTTRTP